MITVWYGFCVLTVVGDPFQAIETGFGYGQWLHGEAVAAGMVQISSFRPLSVILLVVWSIV